MIKTLQSKGETIVEVLICLAILALIVGGAFAAVGQSTKGIRKSQERSEALKLAENQLELLRVAASDQSGTTIFTQDAYFCMIGDDNNGIQPAINPSTSGSINSPFPDLNTTTDKTLAYNTACTTDTGGYKYNFAIDRTTVIAGSQYAFKVYVRWDSLTANSSTPHEEVSLSYKIDK